MQIISTDAAPQPVAAYSQAIVAGDFLFSAGQVGVDPASGKLAAGLEAQTERCLKNVDAVLAAAGLGFADVVKVSLYVMDLTQFATINRVYERYIGSGRPARTTVGTSALPLGALIEIDVVAKIQR